MDERRQQSAERSWDLYLIAAVSAVVVTYVDWTQNRDYSALVKTSWGVGHLLDMPPTGKVVPLVMLLLFAGLSVLLVFALRPGGRREALALGFGVLATVNLGVPARDAPAVVGGEAKPAPTVLASWATAWIPAAHAQPRAATEVRPNGDAWVFVEGLKTLGDTAQLHVFTATGEMVAVRRVGPAFSLSLPKGDYKLLLRQNGHREVALPIKIEEQPLAFRMKTRPVPFEASNFLGAKELHYEGNAELGKLLSDARTECDSRRLDQVAELLKRLPSNDAARLRRSGDIKQSLCMDRLGSARPGP